MKFYIKGHKAYTFDLPNCNGDDVGDAEHIAEYAAEYYHDAYGGSKDDWPIVFTLVYDNGQEVDVTVKREYRVIFSGTKEAK